MSESSTTPFSQSMEHLSQQLGRVIGDSKEENMAEEVELRLAILLGYPNKKLNPELLLFLRKAKCVHPRSVVNTFGGGEKPIMSKMIQAIRTEGFYERHKTSLALLHAFSREFELDQTMETKQFTLSQWMSIRKNKTYDEGFIKREAKDFEEIREGILESTFNFALERMDSIWETIMNKIGIHSTQLQQSSVPSSKSSKKQASTTCTVVENLKKEFPIDEENKEINTPSIARQAAPTPRQPTHMELRSSLEREANNTARPSNEWG